MIDDTRVNAFLSICIDDLHLPEHIEHIVPVVMQMMAIERREDVTHGQVLLTLASLLASVCRERVEADDPTSPTEEEFVEIVFRLSRFLLRHGHTFHIPNASPK